MSGIVPGGGFSGDGQQWVACKPGFFLPVRVLSRLFRRLFLDKFREAHRTGALKFFGQFQPLAESHAFETWCKPLRQQEWVVYAKRPFAGPKAVLDHLSRYTHRVAIANSRLIAHDAQGVCFKWKDYRAKERDRHKTMTLATDEFIRRFLIHVLPHGFHRIRHYGLFANTVRTDNLVKARKLLNDSTMEKKVVENKASDEPMSVASPFICPSCAAPMVVIEVFTRGYIPRAPPKGNS